jgi:hypothetical protein
VPTVTYNGPYYEARRKDTCEPWLRGQPVEVSQEWLEANRKALRRNFTIEGDEPATVDLQDDGIPDVAWNRKDILKWLKDNEVKTGSTYLTKTAALALVESYLNPPVEVEEVKEDLSIADDTTETGDEQ